MTTNIFTDKRICIETIETNLEFDTAKYTVKVVPESCLTLLPFNDT